MSDHPATRPNGAEPSISPEPGESSVAVLCGGVGAARLLAGMVQVVRPTNLTAIVNVGDDMVLHGLHISPDIDTIVYTLSGAVSTERGWGLEGETWQAMETLGRYGGADWFSLGDRDLGTHLFRTQAMAEGRSLAEVTTSIARSWGLQLNLVPVTNDPVPTMVTTTGDDQAGSEREISFQEYFVRLQHSVPVRSVRFAGAEAATPAPGVIEALTTAQRIVIAPSNPVVSIDPVLAVAEIADVIKARRADVVAVSPIVGGRALKGPADRLLVELGRQASATAVADWYRDLIGTLVIDTVDAAEAEAIEAAGVRAAVTDTVMTSPEVAAELCRFILDQEPNP